MKALFTTMQNYEEIEVVKETPNKSVPLVSSYPLYFLRISKVSNMLHHVTMERLRIIECYFIFRYTFLGFFCCFSWKNWCFYHFHFFFWLSIKLPQPNINQSETEIADNKLSAKLYVTNKTTTSVELKSWF